MSKVRINDVGSDTVNRTAPSATRRVRLRTPFWGRFIVV